LIRIGIDKNGNASIRSSDERQTDIDCSVGPREPPTTRFFFIRTSVSIQTTTQAFVYALFVWLISHQPAVLFSQNKSAASNQPAVFFSQNKSAPVISHQSNEQVVCRPLALSSSSKPHKSYQTSSTVRDRVQALPASSSVWCQPLLSSPSTTWCQPLLPALSTTRSAIGRWPSLVVGRATAPSDQRVGDLRQTRCSSPRVAPCLFGLSATSQQYFSLRTNQPSTTSQQYFSLRTNQHQPSATSQTNRL
jgi:hypothetical protein